MPTTVHREIHECGSLVHRDALCWRGRGCASQITYEHPMVQNVSNKCAKMKAAC